MEIITDAKLESPVDDLKFLGLRCTICNAVNDIHLENNPGDYIGRSWGQQGKYFYPDPKDDNFLICRVCADVIRENLSEMHVYAEFNNEEDILP